MKAFTIKEVIIDLPSNIIEFIKEHGDVSINGNITSIHLPQWIIIDNDIGVVKMGLPLSVLPNDLIKSAKGLNQKRYKYE